MERAAEKLDCSRMGWTSYRTGSGSSSGSLYVDWKTEGVPVMVPPGATCCRIDCVSTTESRLQVHREVRTSF